MLKTIKITSKSTDLKKVEQLYIKSFPENERSPLELLLDDWANCSEIFAFYDNDIFCEFISLLTYGDISHIIYFAIDERLRGKGYGARALKHIKLIKPNNRIIADIEVITPFAENNVQREKRKRFYLNNGYVSSNVCYDWQNDSYEILINKGDISKSEFWEFWDCVTKINADFGKF